MYYIVSKRETSNIETAEASTVVELLFYFPKKQALNGLAQESRNPRCQLGALRSPHGKNNIKSSHGRIGDRPERPN